MEIIHVQVTPDIAAQLRELAARADRTLSAEVRRGLRFYVEHEKHRQLLAEPAPAS